MTGTEIGLLLVMLAIVLAIVAFGLHVLDASRDSFAEMLADMEARHVAELERTEQRSAAYVVALSEQHAQHLVDMNAARERALRDVQAEREQWARLFVTRNSTDYGTLRRVERTPEEALGEADVHRAEALAGIRRPHIEADERGEPMIPIGMG